MQSQNRIPNGPNFPGDVARHVRHSGICGRRSSQDPACSRADGKPLVAGRSLRDEPRLDDVPDALRQFFLLGGGLIS